MNNDNENMVVICTLNNVDLCTGFLPYIRIYVPNNSGTYTRFIQMYPDSEWEKITDLFASKNQIKIEMTNIERNFVLITTEEFFEKYLDIIFTATEVLWKY